MNEITLVLDKHLISDLQAAAQSIKHPHPM